jgi:lipopolysaccharide export system protein LptA
MKTSMPKIAVRMIMACLLLVPLSANGASAARQESRGPVKISADRLEADDQAQLLVFSGNAVAVQDDVTMRSDRLTVKYAGAQRDIQQVIAEGSVRIVQGARVATGAKAVLYRAEDRVVLTGSPQVTDGDNFVRGQEITLFLNDKRSVVTGGAGGRVNAVFSPQQTEKKP